MLKTKIYKSNNLNKEELTNFIKSVAISLVLICTIVMIFLPSEYLYIRNIQGIIGWIGIIGISLFIGVLYMALTNTYKTKVLSKISKEFKNLILITIISGFTGILILSLILPSIVTNFSPYLDSLDITNVSNLIGWLGIIIIFISLSISILFLLKSYKLYPLILSLASSFTFGIIIIMASSFIFVGYNRPDLLYGLSYLQRLSKLVSYQGITIIILGSPNILYIIETSLFVILFILKFYQISERK